MVLMLSFGEFTLAKGMPPIGCRIHPPIPIERSPRSKPIINSSVWKNSNLLRRSGANVLQCRLFYLLCFKHVDNWEAYSLPSETGLLISPDFANGSAAISALPRSLACDENKCLESVDRDSFYHLPVLFQPLDGRVRTFRHGSEEGHSLGTRRYFLPLLILK